VKGIGDFRGLRVHSLFESLFSDGTIVVEGEVHQADHQLFPEELACVRHAVERRRAQFATGRVCARRALAMLGLPETPIIVGPGGAPRWPSGVVGSITHTALYCAAVVKPSPPWRAVGLDAEELAPLGAAIENAVSTEAERRWLSGFSGQERDTHVLLLFSAKEAYYKLQHPLTNRFLDFSEVEIEADLHAGTFRVWEHASIPNELGPLTGRFTFAAGKVLCGLELR
jgi:4'-phosphopantetheinyl transferase EntD